MCVSAGLHRWQPSDGLNPCPRTKTKYLQTGFRNWENGRTWNVLACNSIKLSLYTPRGCRRSGCITPLILILGTTCWCVVSLTTWRLYPRQKNVVDIQEAKRQSFICNNKTQRRMGNRGSSRCWIGNGYSYLRYSHFIPTTITIPLYSRLCRPDLFWRWWRRKPFCQC